MQYVRIDESNTHNMVVSYMISPFEDDLDKAWNFTTATPYFEYEQAAQAAMRLLKEPSVIVNNASEISKKDKELIMDELEQVSGYSILETLNVFDENWTVIDCPEDYIFEVGQVFKEEYEEGNEEKIIN